MSIIGLQQTSAAFIEWLYRWLAELEPLQLSALTHGRPERVAILCTDLVVGFCQQGPLSSPRVARVVPANVALFQKAHAAGVRHFVLPQDVHSPDAIEFDAYPPHCIAGSDEAETAPELMALPFSDQFTVIAKNSINPAIHTGLEAWLAAHPEVDTFIVTGDCTDICVYQLAIHLRARANALGLTQRVVLPADCVATYDVPVNTAAELGILPHDGDLLHAIFLYSMALNGVQVVASLI